MNKEEYDKELSCLAETATKRAINSNSLPKFRNHAEMCYLWENGMVQPSSFFVMQTLKRNIQNFNLGGDLLERISEIEDSVKRDDQEKSCLENKFWLSPFVILNLVKYSTENGHVIEV